jgi:hypothetical protein
MCLIEDLHDAAFCYPRVSEDEMDWLLARAEKMVKAKGLVGDIEV